MVVVGSKAWCESCAALYLKLAEKRFSKAVVSDFDVHIAHHYLFESFIWSTTKPWST